MLKQDIADPTCNHARRTVINGYELLRKYLCQDCDATMTCACDRSLARYVRPHQATQYRDPSTGAMRSLSDPLVPELCHGCRGETPPAYPRRAHRKEATVMHRYYWRELWRGTDLRFLTWCQAQNLPLGDGASSQTFDGYRTQFAETYAAIQQEVLDELRILHDASPIYDTSEPSADAILSARNVPVRNIRACYVKPTVDRVLVLPESGADLDEAVGVEEFVAAQLRADGRQVMFCESRPFHALFGVMMWMWVQDMNDPQCRAAAFAGRDGVGADAHGLIWTVLPSDFGSEDYGKRRAYPLTEHFELLQEDIDFLWTFDYWLEPSRGLRQYLWAYEADVMQRARELVRVLGPVRVKLILAYLAQNYWGRYLGWPDLVSWRDTTDGPQDVLFTEVKSGGDRMSADQLDWVQGNAQYLKFPFEIAKVHRSRTITREIPR